MNVNMEGNEQMIKGCNNRELKNKGISEKYFLFYQVWKELTEVKTLDSYQYRVMNTLSVLNELKIVIDNRLNRYYTTNHNIDDCKREAILIVQSDAVLRKHYPMIWRRLIAHLNEKTETDSQQRALKYQIEYCYGIIREEYFQFLIQDLEDDIAVAEKKGIIEKTNQLISNCVAMGWSSMALYRLIDILHGSNENDSKWMELKERLQARGTDRYFVYMPLKVSVKAVKGLTKSDSESLVRSEIASMGIPILKSEEVRTACAIYTGVARIENHWYMMIEVDAYDFFAATHYAIGRGADVLNLLSFYNYIEAWSIKDISCGVVNVAQKSLKWVKAKEIYGIYDYMEGASRIFKASKKIEKGKFSSLQQKLRAAYSYTNMGKAASAQEDKFMNLWVALESLCRSEVYDNIIGNILDTVPAALCLRYIYRHYRNFMEDCLRCGIELKFTKREIRVLTQAKEDLVKEMLSLFHDEDIYLELQAKCQINDLLEMRCEMLYEIANNPQKMFEKIERHYLNVRQQISRLYRMRNEIAHSAMSAEGSLILFIEHLDDYLSGFVSEVVMCAETKKEDNIELVFQIIKDNYQMFLDIKNGKKNSEPAVMLEGLVKTGIIALI